MITVTKEEYGSHQAGKEINAYLLSRAAYAPGHTQKPSKLRGNGKLGH